VLESFFARGLALKALASLILS
jgi:hypothetical protein